jgi:hypothetical protein
LSHQSLSEDELSFVLALVRRLRVERDEDTGWRWTECNRRVNQARTALDGTPHWRMVALYALALQAHQAEWLAGRRRG